LVSHRGGEPLHTLFPAPNEYLSRGRGQEKEKKKKKKKKRKKRKKKKHKRPPPPPRPPRFYLSRQKPHLFL
jgi:hypothetical protein